MRSEESPVGTRIDRYEVVARIGSGGFGTVYRARHVHTLRDVALKLLDPELATDASALERFKREAQLAVKIDSPHVVDVLDWGVLPSGQSFLVMELLEGRDLASVLNEEGKLPSERTVAIAEQFLDGLSAVHRAGAVHRDLKPANIFIAGDRVKLLDFGAARGDRKPGDLLRTQTGVTIGTPLYMAPEQLRAGTADVRTDIYAAAVVVYEMVSGRRPHEGKSYEDLVANVCTEDARALGPDVPPTIARAVMRGLERDPARRWQNADAFARALRGESEPVTARASPGAKAVDVARTADVAMAETVPHGSSTSEQLATEVNPSRVTKRRAIGSVGVIAIIAFAVLAGIGVYALVRPHGAPSTAKPPPDAITMVVRDDAPATMDADVLAPIPVLDAGTDAALPATVDVPRSRECQVNLECPTMDCTCASGRHERIASCGGNGHCVVGAAACTKACSRARGWNGVYEVIPLRPEDCQASPQCKKRGACVRRRAYNQGIEYECVKSCRELSSCRSIGLCSDISVESPDCIASGTDCVGTEVCATNGSCAARGGTCVAGSAADCAASASCKEEGLCGLNKGTCAAVADSDCARSPVCTDTGRCTVHDGTCVAGTNADCEKSAHCALYGRCTLDQRVCRAVTDSDCRRGEDCTLRNKCHAKGGVCVP